MDEKMKICLVIPSIQAGGMERVMAELASYFCNKKHLEIHLLLYGINPEIFFKLPDELIVHKPYFEFNNRLRFFSTVKRMFYVRSEIKKIDPVTVLSFGEYWNSFVLLSLTGLKYPVFISDRCSPEKRFSLFHTFLRRLLYPSAKGIIAQTARARSIYEAVFRHKNIRVIGNPLREIEQTDHVTKETSVLMVGRYIRSKKQDELIQIFLNIDKPGWKLILAGYDHLGQNFSEDLKKLIKSKNARQRIILTGKQANTDILYQSSMIFASTSVSEGFPNAIGEAMSAGLPVVAFDCVAGPSEMIADGENGYLIPLNDYDLFQLKLEMLMDDADLRERLGTRAKEDIKRFSVPTIGQLYLDFIMNTN